MISTGLIWSYIDTKPAFPMVVTMALALLEVFYAALWWQRES